MAEEAFVSIPMEEKLFKVIVANRKGRPEIRASGVTLEAAQAIEKTIRNFGPFKSVVIVPDDGDNTGEHQAKGPTNVSRSGMLPLSENPSAST